MAGRGGQVHQSFHLETEHGTAFLVFNHGLNHNNSIFCFSAFLCRVTNVTLRLLTVEELFETLES